MNTPWGRAQGTERITKGITFYSTASHGGYHISSTLNAQMPDALRLDDGWYEEDCDWARVVLAFPAYFPAGALQDAHDCLRNWCPRAYERLYAVTLKPGESYMLDHHPDGFGRGLR